MGGGCRSSEQWFKTGVSSHSRMKQFGSFQDAYLSTRGWKLKVGKLKNLCKEFYSWHFQQDMAAVFSSSKGSYDLWVNWLLFEVPSGYQIASDNLCVYSFLQPWATEGKTALQFMIKKKKKKAKTSKMMFAVSSRGTFKGDFSRDSEDGGSGVLNVPSFSFAFESLCQIISNHLLQFRADHFLFEIKE